MEKIEEDKSLYDYKLGETIDKPLMNGLLKPPIKLVKIGYTYQDTNGAQMIAALLHDDYVDPDENDDDDENEDEDWD